MRDKTSPPVQSARLLLGLTASMALFMLASCERIGAALDVTGQVAQIPPQPIASERLRVALPKTGAVATLAPVSQRDDVTIWQTLDGITVSFRRGVLIATRGLGDDLMSSDVDHTLAMLSGSLPQADYPQVRSYLDGEDQTQFQTYQCRRTDLSTQQTKLGAVTRDLRHVTELCTSTEGDVSNSYWLDATGAVVKSRQWVAPNVGYMETEYVQQ